MWIYYCLLLKNALVAGGVHDSSREETEKDSDYLPKQPTTFRPFSHEIFLLPFFTAAPPLDYNDVLQRASMSHPGDVLWRPLNHPGDVLWRASGEAHSSIDAPLSVVVSEEYMQMHRAAVAYRIQRMFLMVIEEL